VTEDIVAHAQKWLQICASCDIGFPSACTCPEGDPRNVILALVQEIERLRNQEKQ
jgi:hypothetical protein